ncbi:hypothetical protein HK098_002550 [Nowakowskiella sp. JEL0407]|nr:hypothetical protein HK098_002550 [Nowakowskiella sp. JEL0407]
MKDQEFINLTCLFIDLTLLGSSSASPVSNALTNTTTTIQRRVAINWHPKLWANGCDWVGNDITFVKTTSDQCGSKCEQTPLCMVALRREMLVEIR